VPFGGYSHLTHARQQPLLWQILAIFGESSIITANFTLEMRALSGDTSKVGSIATLSLHLVHAVWPFASLKFKLWCQVLAFCSQAVLSFWPNLAANSYEL
jgi:hypothetical protein